MGGDDMNSYKKAKIKKMLAARVVCALLAGGCFVLLPVRVALAAPVMPTLDYRGASPDVNIATTSSNTTAAMNITSKQVNNVVKWIDFSIGQGGKVQYDGNNYLNYVTGHSRSEIDGVLKGGGSIYLVNPNGILFGSTARVDVGSLNLSTRRLTDQQLASYETGTAALFRNDSAAVGDVINLGKLNADLIQVEGKNITFKNVADVTKGGTLKDGDITGGKVHFEAADGSVTLTVNNETGNEGEIHLGFAVGVDGTLNGSAAEGVSASQYTNVTVPDFAQTPSHSFNHWMTNITPTHYMLVRNGYELQNMQNNLTETNGTKMPGHYMLANDIDLQRDVKSFQPIGYKNNSNQEFVFEGKFDGLNYKINDLKIDTSGLSPDKNVACGVGLFGINAGTVENVGVESNIAVDKPSVGGIVGINKGTIRNVYHTGSVIGNGDVGGIAGHNESGASIALAYNTGKITANSSCSNVGGIAGVNEGTIAQVYNTGEVGDGNTGNNVGGIAGKLAGASEVPGETYRAKIEDAYNYNTDSTSTVPLITGSSNVGGIVGLVEGNSTDKYLVRNTYNTGIISANTNSGGIIGNVSSAGSGNPTVDVVSSYFSEGTNNGYGTQVSENALKQSVTFAGTSIPAENRWDISNEGGEGTTWRIYEGQTMPLLTAFLKTKDLVKVYEYDHNPHSVVDNDPLLDDPNIKKSDQFRGNWNNYSNNLTNAGVVNILKENRVFLYSLQDGYDIADMKLIVQPKALTATFADISKTYDGTANATAGAGTLKAGDIISGDNVELNAAGIVATFADKNAGDNKTVNYTGIALSGTDANNYSIATTVTGAGTINKKQLTVTFDPIRKTYDGTTNDVNAMGYAMPSRPGKLAGVVAGEDKKVSVTGKATYADKNVSNSYDSYDKTVYYSGLALGAGTDGDESANYVLASTAMTVVDNGRIDKANVTLTAKDVTKTYDGTTDVTGGTLVEYSGTIFASDILSGGTFAFEDKNAGKNKTVKVSSGSARITDKDTGADTSGNYNITYEDNTTSTIKAKEITASFAAISKTYDGTTEATAGAGTLNAGGVISGDNVSLNESGITAVYEDKNAGNGKTVNYKGIALSGTDANNYSIATTATGAGTIDKKAITATFADISKTYDGTTDATAGAGTLEGVIAADKGKVNVSANAAYDEKNVGNRTVNYSGVALSGDEAANYSIVASATGKGTIYRKALELVADSVTIHEGYPLPATFTGSVTGFVAGENISIGDTLRFALSDPSATAVGSYGITGTLNGSASGSYGLNYTFSNAASNANAFVITAKPASVEDIRLSDLIPGIKGTAAGDIKVTEMDDAMEQASDKQAGIIVGFAVSQGVLSVDMDRGSSFENTGALNAAMDMVQKTDDTIGTEESKREKEAGENE